MKERIDWLSVWQFALSALAVFGLWSIALLLFGLGIADGFRTLSLGVDPLPLLLTATGAVASGFFVLPSVLYSLRRLMGRPGEKARLVSNIWWPILIIITLPVVLGLGELVSQNSHLSWLMLPPLHILAIGLPILLLVYLGLRDLPLGSSQRIWGAFDSGLVLGPLLILVAEVLALVGAVIVAILYIASQPELRDQLMNLANQLQFSQPSPEAMVKLFGPYLTRPIFIFGALAFAAVIVPLIEEAIKPVGVWLLAGKHLTPAAGFAAGVLSGAGYAFFESLALTPSGENWVFLVVARMGTAVIHILNTGLMGWALAKTWQDGRYLRLGVTYLTVVLIHGLWNALTLVSVLASVSTLTNQATLSPLITRLSEVSPYILIILAVSAFVVFVLANRRLQRTEEIIPVPALEEANLNLPTTQL